MEGIVYDLLLASTALLTLSANQQSEHLCVISIPICKFFLLFFNPVAVKRKTSLNDPAVVAMLIYLLEITFLTRCQKADLKQTWHITCLVVAATA